MPTIMHDIVTGEYDEDEEWRKMYTAQVPVVLLFCMVDTETTNEVKVHDVLENNCDTHSLYVFPTKTDVIMQRFECQ